MRYRRVLASKKHISSVVNFVKGKTYIIILSISSYSILLLMLVAQSKCINHMHTDSPRYSMPHFFPPMRLLLFISSNPHSAPYYDKSLSLVSQSRPLCLNVSFISVQFSSVTQSCPTLCDPINSSTPGLPVHHHLPEFTQIHVH